MKFHGLWSRLPLHRVLANLSLGRRKLVMLIAGIICVMAGWYLIFAAGLYNPFEQQRASLSHQVVDSPPGTRGTLRISAYSPTPGPLPALRHNLVLVNGSAYSGMEDNDLRGYLDGNFKWGWNQVGQIHVRIGRRARGSFFGEYELFRLVQRWDSIALPPEVHIHQARLRLGVEEGPPFSVTVYLYEVKKDWNPGKGGIEQDNTSPPQVGEVWWNDLAYKQRRWGLPGAGFASDTHPEADVAAMPLAEARYLPGDQFVEFSSPALAHYLSKRVQTQQPLLFLLKLSDYQEDRRGSVLSLYSGNHGDDRNVQRRPHLFVEWESATETSRKEQEIFLEYGRSYVVPFLPTPDSRFFVASFITSPGYEAPIIEMRGGDANTTSAWRRVSVPFAADWQWAEIRLTAVADPVVLGEAFAATLHDTWVRTATPEEQQVPWTFVSPTGESFVVPAEYHGHYQWGIRFQPNEVGRWHYFWTQNFLKQPYKSAEGTFDVVGGDQANVIQHLKILQDAIRNSELTTPSERIRVFGRRFVTLERAAMHLQTPESFASEAGRDLHGLLNENPRPFRGEAHS